MNIRPANKDLLYIEWNIAGEIFNLYRSENNLNNFELIREGLNQPFYLDEDVNMYNAALNYYYKVEGMSGSLIVGTDGPASLNYSGADNIAVKVIHEAQTALRVMNNPGVWFLLKQRKSTPCPVCWNPITKKPKFSNCDVCGGTGKLQGYHPPIPSRISQDVSQFTMSSGPEDSENVKLSPIRAWIMNVPLVYPEDVMVDVTNQRFKVVNVARRTKSQYVIRQILDLVPLDKGHPSYNIQIEWGEMPYQPPNFS